MKEKKTGVKKVLLMAISCVLVAAISVSLTLAYLTAKTNEKDNLFKATGGVKGEVIEPEYDLEKAKAFKPGQKIPKNPMVDNDTEEYDVWVGASVEYMLSADGGDNWKTVPYSVFKQYVSLEKYVGDATTWTGSTIPPAVKWEQMSADSSASDENKKKDYFFYNTMLLKQTEEVDDPSTENVDEAEHAAGTEENDEHNGTTGSETSDNTSEIFKSVTPKAGLDISPKYKSNPSATELANGYSVPKYNDNGTMTNKTLVTATNDIPVTNINLDKLAFNKFNFKIKIVGYGVQDNDQDVAAGDKATSGGVTTVSGDSQTNLKDEILTKLGGKVAS